jgi:hypothetical protein
VSFAGLLKGHKRCPMPVHVKMLRWKDLGAVSANEAACNSVSVWKLVCKWRRNTRLDMYEIMFSFFRKDGGWHHKWYSMNWQVCISMSLRYYPPILQTIFSLQSQNIFSSFLLMREKNNYLLLFETRASRARFFVHFY